ncbi:MAG: UDP-N-acetylmuramoyl-L-alanine--D-glutamate ligase [Caldisericia bacterium]
MDFKDKKVSVIGIGGSKRSGFYSSLLLKKEGANVFLSEIKKEDEFKNEIEILKQNGISFEFGINSEKIYESEIIVPCPGISIKSPLLIKAKELNKKIIGELELSYKFINGEVVGITGTSGKSTTTTLTYEFLKESKIKSHLGGNIGIPLSSLVINEREGIFVLEVSCFQLETIEKFKPKVATFLNFHEDHLDRYVNLNEYLFFKKRIFENQDKYDFAILNYDDEIVRNLSKEIKSKIYYFSIEKEVEGIFLKDDKIFLNLDDEKIFVSNRNESSLIGDFNSKNIISSILSSYLVGAKIDSIRNVLKNFKGLPHRLQFIDTINGISFINDSKSTKPESSIQALFSFPENKSIIILGGSKKNTDFTKLCEVVKKRAKYAIVIGATKDDFIKIFNEIGYEKYIPVTSLEEAVDISFEIGEMGDYVILSPACASFDMFHDFEDRGEKFIDIVKRIKNEKN